VSFAESKEVGSSEAPSRIFRAPLCLRLLCLSSCYVDPHPDSGRGGASFGTSLAYFQNSVLETGTLKAYSPGPIGLDLPYGRSRPLGIMRKS